MRFRSSTPQMSRTDERINWTNDRRFGVTRHNRFAMDVDGYVHIPTAGVWTFELRSDDGSRLVIGGSQVINNDGLHGPRSRTGRKRLGVGFHHFNIKFFENAGGAYLRFRARPPSGSWVVPTVYRRTGSSPFVPGGHTKVFFNGGGLSSVGQCNYAARQPRFTRTDATLNFIGHRAFRLRSGRHNNFGTKTTGYIHAPVAGRYTFTTRSDDGSKVWINDRLVVNNDGLHGPRTRSGHVTLPVGYHRVRVEFFERQGHAVLRFFQTNPGSNRRTLATIFRRFGSVAGNVARRP